jgi:LmbE family N-acetylglucosaminyl deacetylase
MPSHAKLNSNRKSQIPNSKSPVALAIGAHPDDIEFLMAGTLLLLREAGWEIHYYNLCSGNCGSAQCASAQTRALRRREARSAARLLGAHYHPSFTDDLELFYDDPTIRRVAAVVREVAPAILLTHSPQDYMEDHANACRVAVTAAFARGMPNYHSWPRRRPINQDVTLYHSMPYGLRDGLRRLVVPGAFVNTASVHAAKRAALAAHQSQKAWLDASQGVESYLKAVDEMSLAVGRLSGQFAHAEGWRRHSHLGFCAPASDPLRAALGANCLVNEDYERDLERGV